MMKSIALAVVLTLLALGCVQTLPPSSSGRDFPEQNVSKIIRGQTTERDLLEMFGQPLSKTITSETEKRWEYKYISGTATVVRSPTSVQTKYTGKSKTLDILLRNGVVTDFTFNESDVIQ